MLTDREIENIYWNLLGRTPEDDATIAGFRSFYTTLDSGRRAIFLSTEFRRFYERQTGQIADSRHHHAASLAHYFLSGRGSPLSLSGANETLCARMRRFFPERDQSYFAVAIGNNPTVTMSDLAPLGGPKAALLHIAPEFPPHLPRVALLADQTSAFHIGLDAQSVSSLLSTLGRPIDALYLLDKDATVEWVDVLRPHFAEPALIAIAAGQAGFDPAELEAVVRKRYQCAPSIDLDGLRLIQVGGWMLPVCYAQTPCNQTRPDRANFPALAIAAIVRNEAACIKNMLLSTHAIASYYAILDTGSHDDTVSMARAFLAESGVPYSLTVRDRTEFNDSFSAMRNAALAQIPDWVPWVLMLDADEELVEEDLEPLLRLIADADRREILCLALPRYNFPSYNKEGVVISYPDLQRRLLRNTADRRVSYSGAVHETIVSTLVETAPLDTSLLGGARGGPHIHHLVRRFRTPDEEAAKQDFYKSVAARARQ